MPIALIVRTIVNEIREICVCAYAILHFMSLRPILFTDQAWNIYNKVFDRHFPLFLEILPNVGGGTMLENRRR